MASFDIDNNPNYLEYLTIQQLESLLPTYRSDTERRIKELIEKKKIIEEDKKYNIDDCNR